MDGKNGELVLSRRLQESLVIRLPDGSEIFIRVADMDRGRVRLAVKAKKDVQIWRLEADPARGGSGAGDTTVIPNPVLRRAHLLAVEAASEPDGEGSEM